MANGIAIKDVTNKLQELNGEEVVPISSGADEPEVVEVDTLKEYINADIDTALDTKQDVINDLATIRSGAALGATALQDSDISGWAKASTKPTYTVSEIDGAQEELESGTNIKTINNESILGSGNIFIQGGGGGDVNVIESITFNGSAVPVDASKNAAITYSAPVTSVNGNTGAVTISVPTKVSDLTNDSGFITSYTETDPVFRASAAASITSADITAWNGKSTFSGSYNDLTDKPTLFSGDYNDLSNKPTIPTVPTTLSSFTDDLGSSPTHTHSQYLTSHQDISVKADKVSNATNGHLAGLDANGNLTDSGFKIVVVDEATYESLTKDNNTIYLITEE